MTDRPQLNRAYRRIFHAEHPDPPWTCHFCGQLIDHWGRDTDGLAIYHVDLDHENNALENLAPSRAGCHIEYHATLREPTSAETRAKLTAIHTGRKNSPETIEHMREAALRRWATR